MSSNIESDLKGIIEGDETLFVKPQSRIEELILRVHNTIDTDIDTIQTEINWLDSAKTDNPFTTYYADSGALVDLSITDNYVIQPENGLSSELSMLTIKIPDDTYSNYYMCNISFRSGHEPTSVCYPRNPENSYVINWVGTDCSVDDGHSIFQPSKSTMYDVIIYFNGICFVGLVNGYPLAYDNSDKN